MYPWGKTSITAISSAQSLHFRSVAEFQHSVPFIEYLLTLLFYQSTATKRFGQQGRGGRDGRGFGRGMQGGRGGRGAPTQQEPQFSFGGKRSKTQPGRGAAGRGGRMGGRGNFRRDRKMDRVPSLAVGGEWTMVEEFDLPALLKLVANPPQVEDLVWTGHLDQYDEAYDKLSTRAAKPLKRIENKVFFAVRTADDPILEKFAVEEIGNVYATDAILALLMASPRSVYSWDITIEKTNGILFLDKRENSLFDFLTVSETAREPPQASEDIDEINHPEKLSIEATMINQNFSQQVLKEKDATSRKTVINIHYWSNSTTCPHCLMSFLLKSSYLLQQYFSLSLLNVVRTESILRGR